MRKDAAPVRQVGLFFLCVALFSSAAAYNRFPLVYSDTGTYLSSALTLVAPPDRPIFYGLFLRAANAFSASLWLPVLAQAAVLAWLLLLLIKKVRPGTKAEEAAALAVFLAAATGLPWVSGQLLPDIFLSYLAISLYLLIFHGPWNDKDKILLSLVFVGSLIVHFSHVVIAAALLLCLAVNAQTRKKLLLPAALFMLSVAVMSSVKLFTKEKAASNGHVFITGHLIESRVVDRLLDEHCAEKNYALCPYKDDVKKMTGTDFPWSGTLKKIGDWDYSGAVLWPVIIDASLYYPLDDVKSVVADSLHQFFTFATGDGLIPSDDSRFVYKVIRDKLPGSFAAFEASEEQTGRLPRLLAPLSMLHRAVALLAIALAALFLLPSPYRPASGMRPLIGFMLLFCAINASICGTVSGVFDRFQGRIVWLLVFSTALAALGVYRREAAPETGPLAKGWPSRRALKAFAAGVAVCCLALVLGASRISNHYDTTAPSQYEKTPVVVWPRPDKVTRKVPLSAFGNTQGMAVGVQIEATLISGVKFIGTVTGIGKDEITVEASWEMVRWDPGLAAAPPRS